MADEQYKSSTVSAYTFVVDSQETGPTFQQRLQQLLRKPRSKRIEPDDETGNQSVIYNHTDSGGCTSGVYIRCATGRMPIVTDSDDEVSELDAAVESADLVPEDKQILRAALYFAVKDDIMVVAYKGDNVRQ